MQVFQAVRFVVSQTFKAARFLLIFYVWLTIFISLLSFVNLLVFKEVIDTANGQKTILGLSIVSLFSIWFLYQIFEKILEKFSEYLWNIIDLKQTIYNTSNFVDKLSTLDLSNFENPQIYDKIWRTFNRIPWQLKYNLDAAVKLLSKSVEVFISVFIFFLASPFSAILIIIANIVTIIVKSKLGEQTFNIYKSDSETRRKFEYASSLVTQRESLIEIKQFHGFTFIKEKLLNIYNLFSKKQKNLFKKSWIYLTFIEMLPIVASFVFLLNIIIHFNDHTMTTGTFVFLFTNVLVFNGALWNLTYFLNILITDSHFVHDAIDYYAIKRNIDFPRLTASQEIILMEKIRNPTIRIENVSFHYPNAARMVLKNINLTIPNGQNIAIIGENGAGKTTLVKLLIRIYDPTEGRILLNGIDLKDIPEGMLFKLYSTLFQSFGKFYLTIRENMELASGKKLTDEEYLKALRLSNAAKYIEKFPKKLDQQLGPNYTDGIDLSGGQWQQLAIGKALVRKTPVLILDEPTSSVDAKSEMEIFDRLNRETKDSTVIFISHRFSTIKDAERIVVIDRGKIIEDGNHEVLMGNKGKYKTLYVLQAERYFRK